MDRHYNYCNLEYVAMVQLYARADYDSLAARRLYAEPQHMQSLRRRGVLNPQVPPARTIVAVTQRLHDHGQFQTPAHAQGRGPLTVISPKLIRDPRRSTRKAAARLCAEPLGSGYVDDPSTLSRSASEVSINGNEIKVFCPKCNTEVSHTAEGIQQDQTKILIAKVYHYFEQEYEELKMIYGDLDLTPLSKFCQRTALATGVSETMLMQILKEQERRNEERQRELPQKERAARKRRRQTTHSSSEEDSSDDNVEHIKQPSPSEDEEPEIFVPAVKVEPSDDDTNKEYTDPIALEVKVETHEDEEDTTDATPAPETSATKRKAKKTPRLGDETSVQMAKYAATERSRTATPVAGIERGPNRQSAARRALLLEKLRATPVRDLQSPPPRLHALPVQATPGGDSMLVEQTPGGHLRIGEARQARQPSLDLSLWQQTQAECSTSAASRSKRRETEDAALGDFLCQNRTKRKVTHGLQAPVPTAARQILTVRKLHSLGHPDRTLVPDASPSKRQTNTLSPERQPSVMAAPPVEGCVEANPAEPTAVAVPISEVLHSSELNAAEQTDVEASTSGVTISFELLSNEPAGAVASTSGVSRSFDVGGEIVAASSSSHTSGALQTGEHLDDVTLTDALMQLTDFCTSDDDMDADDNDCFLPTVHERDATAEPACVSDLTAFQARVLRREDVANDRAIRDIVPKDCYTFTWTKDKQTFSGLREQFTGTSGPTFDVTDKTRAIDIFDKIFDVDFIDLICKETNRNAEQKIALMRKQKKLTRHSRFTRWTPTDRDEMVSFLSTIILQGLYPLPEEQAYFKFNGFGTRPYFSRIMSYNRFLLLKTFLHFVDDQTVKDTTRLCKIRPVIDHFNAKFSSLYMPSQEIVIDESLTITHGRLNFARKVSSKAAKDGVKTYELCESSSGYVWKFFVYVGRDKPSSTTDSADGRKDRPVEDEAIDRFAEDERVVGSTDRLITGENGDRATSAKIVYGLIEPLLHRGHTVVMDNILNSPLLLRSLKKKNTDCYGTLRLNREHVPDFVKNMTKTDLQPGEVMVAYCSDLSILVWRDAKIVSLISTYHNLQIETQDNRQTTTTTNNRLIYKPNIVLDYNKSMGGVDKKDQFLSTQPLERLRDKVWYTKLFRQLYNAAIYNCFVIFSSFHRKISHRQFRIVLAEDLLKRHKQIDLTTENRRLTVRTDLFEKENTRIRKTRHTKDRPTVDANHFPVRTGSKTTVCRMCTKKSRTIWKCEECDVNLCVEGCFKAYHKP